MLFIRAHLRNLRSFFKLPESRIPYTVSTYHFALEANL